MTTPGRSRRQGAEGPDAAAGDFVEVLYCVRKDQARSYMLRAVAGGAELWRVTESEAAGHQSIKESDFQSSEQLAAFLDELRRSLLAGGWRET